MKLIFILNAKSGTFVCLAEIMGRDHEENMFLTLIYVIKILTHLEITDIILIFLNLGKHICGLLQSIPLRILGSCLQFLDWKHHRTSTAPSICKT